MSDDLGKRVTQATSFEWKPGMVKDRRGALDLGHPANTGFLLELLWAKHRDAMVDSGRVSLSMSPGGDPVPPMYELQDDETFGHLVTRALLGVRLSRWEG